MGINFLQYPQNQLAAGGKIGPGNLSQLVAFQVVLVGFWSSAHAKLVSVGGSITCQSSTPLTVQTVWPADAVGSLGTAENTNSTYSLVPAQSSTSIAQTGWDSTSATLRTPNRIGRPKPLRTL